MSETRTPDALATVMHCHRTDIATAMAALCKTVRVIGDCRDTMEKILAAPDRYPSADENHALLGLTRAAKHLTDAVADVPEEMWAVMLADCIDHPEETIARMRKQLKVA